MSLPVPTGGFTQILEENEDQMLFCFFFLHQTEVYIGPITCLPLGTYKQSAKWELQMITDDSSIVFQIEDEKAFFLVGWVQ